MRPNPLFSVFIVALFGVACGQSGEGRFTVSTVQQHEECLSTAFPFEPVFLASRERAQSMGIFLQSRGGSFQFVDVVYFEVFDPATVEVGVAYDLVPIATEESRIVSAIELQASCPELDDSLTIEGSLVFDSFSREVDGIIAGSIEDGRIVSLRTGEVVADGFSGAFSFPVQVGQPYEEFRN